MATAELPEGFLFCIENPLLDISANVDVNFLKKYNLKPNGAVMGHKNHANLLSDMKSHYQVDFIAGGSCQNSARVAEWILGKPNVVTFMGSVGSDEYGATLTKQAEADGLRTMFEVQAGGAATGTCAVLITGHLRSLCADLGASQLLSMEYLENSIESVRKAKFIYTTGFFLGADKNMEKFHLIAQHAVSTNCPFLFNLSAEYVQKEHTKEIMDAMPYVDVLFGNESVKTHASEGITKMTPMFLTWQEVKAFAEAQKLQATNLAEIGKKIVALPKQNDNRGRIVVITQGTEPILVISKEKVESFPIIKVPKDQIKDTNGCGDSFVGGFLAQYIQGKSIADCVHCGLWAASEVIKNSGCQFMKDMRYVAVEKRGKCCSCCSVA